MEKGQKNTWKLCYDTTMGFWVWGGERKRALGLGRVLRPAIGVATRLATAGRGGGKEGQGRTRYNEAGFFNSDYALPL